MQDPFKYDDMSSFCTDVWLAQLRNEPYCMLAHGVVVSFATLEARRQARERSSACVAWREATLPEDEHLQFLRSTASDPEKWAALVNAAEVPDADQVAKAALIGDELPPNIKALVFAGMEGYVTPQDFAAAVNSMTADNMPEIITLLKRSRLWISDGP